MTPAPCCREVAQQEREHDFRVYKEVMFDEMAEPDLGTEEERYRVCTPYPFELNMTGPDALLDFELHIDNLKNFVYYSPSAPRLRTAVCSENASSGSTGLQSLLHGAYNRQWLYTERAGPTCGSSPSLQSCHTKDTPREEVHARRHSAQARAAAAGARGGAAAGGGGAAGAVPAPHAAGCRQQPAVPLRAVPPPARLCEVCAVHAGVAPRRIPHKGLCFGRNPQLPWDKRDCPYWICVTPSCDGEVDMSAKAWPSALL